VPIEGKRPIAAGVDDVRRRAALAVAAARSSFAAFEETQGLGARAESVGYTNDTEEFRHCAQPNDGKAVADAKFVFDRIKIAEPALRLTDTIPPLSSEGVHTHRRDDAKQGGLR
jgi:hypothetical protein